VSRRRFYPVQPIRWIHIRRGSAPSTQHILAQDTDPYPGRTRAETPTLCGKHLGDGTIAGASHRGPATLKPLVTVNPRENLPRCPKCADALARCLATDSHVV
jgi:hypothetical protein